MRENCIGLYSLIIFVYFNGFDSLSCYDIQYSVMIIMSVCFYLIQYNAMVIISIIRLYVYLFVSMCACVSVCVCSGWSGSCCVCVDVVPCC